MGERGFKRNSYCYTEKGWEKGGLKGKGLNQEYVRMWTEDEEKKAWVCKRKEGKPCKSSHRAKNKVKEGKRG